MFCHAKSAIVLPCVDGKPVVGVNISGKNTGARVAAVAMEQFQTQRQGRLTAVLGGCLQLLFASDYSFTSASAAAAAVIGASANGRISWKLADGRCYADWEAEGTPPHGDPEANG